MVGEEGLEPSEPKHLGYNQARYQLRSTPSYKTILIKDLNLILRRSIAIG